eukprot:CAMPEP_0178938314 /NCGR_PEP_ID=MMETSP0786-20121207/26261_1 /TAXON_ID=186022 /ORGANISM="Thalassionema frauenfeldii, Strain CCMP 1798" /LENGTH=402 /DNA_ID=CAMNT_0020617017 /DNA_START=160 /DNA_END=1365 /DNA_ORIENTATION=+
MTSLRVSSLTLLVANLVAIQVVEGCLYTIEQIVIGEESAKDYSKPREYTICSRRDITVGKLDYSNKLIPGSGDSPIPLRSNLYIKCGTSGGRENKCIVRGGDVQVDGTNYFGLDKSDVIENVVIEGITFIGTSRYSVWATKRGDITFIDCEWKEITEAYVPLYFDYFNAANRNSYLDVNFIGCDFRNNKFYGDGAYPAVIVANGEQNRLNLERNLFIKNDYEFNNTQFQSNSFLIETSGLLNMELNCFSENKIGVAPVASYGTQILSERNFGTQSNGRKCKYIARFDTQVQFDSFAPGCSNYETVEFCERFLTNSPSSSPSNYPTDIPTGNPTSEPSPSPSYVPTDIPSSSPTTAEPSHSPTLSSSPSVSSKPSDTIPSSSPSIEPSVTPLMEPTTSSAAVW